MLNLAQHLLVKNISSIRLSTKPVTAELAMTYSVYVGLQRSKHNAAEANDSDK
jgi:hypothetical protein